MTLNFLTDREFVRKNTQLRAKYDIKDNASRINQKRNTLKIQSDEKELRFSITAKRTVSLLSQLFLLHFSSIVKVIAMQANQKWALSEPWDIPR